MHSPIRFDENSQTSPNPPSPFPPPLNVEENYSTLEATEHHPPTHSTLEPYYSKPEENTGALTNTTLPPYNQNSHDLAGKTEYPTVTPSFKGSNNEPGDGKRRVCGMSFKFACLLGAILLLAIVGAAVGGAVVGTRSKNDTATSPAVEATATTSPTSDTGSPNSTTPSSTISSLDATPSSGTSCPNFKNIVRSDIWYHIYDPNWDFEQLYLNGNYSEQDGLGSVNMRWGRVYEPTMQWNFRRLDVTELGQKFGCREGARKVQRLYHIACRGTEPRTEMRLGLEAGYSTDAGPDALIGLNLAPADTENLSQLWFIDEVDKVADTDFFLLRNLALGDDWSLAADAILVNNGEEGEEARKKPTGHMQTANRTDTRNKWKLTETSALTDPWCWGSGADDGCAD